GQYQREDIKAWDFGDLPDSVQSNLAGLPVRAFPCLKIQQERIDLSLDAKESRALANHRQAVLKLIQLHLPESERYLKSVLNKALSQIWLLAKGMNMGSQNEIIADLCSAIFQEVCLPFSQPLPRTQAQFESCLAKRGELNDFAQKLIDEFKQWLQLRHNILKAMSGAISLDRAMAFSDAKAHLERLLNKGFVRNTPWPHLQHYSRYLKAILYRLDKLQGNLPRDRQSMLEFESLWQPYQEKCQNVDLADYPELVEFGWLLEEWRVAMFAQPIGTSESVSLKRLEKRWQELKN
ncbi:MAG: DUF3418 domain-containing protein, partial [Venatoribacter sp.]